MSRIICLLVLGICSTSPCRAFEILKWERLPLAVPLLVGQERVIFLDRSVRVGLPEGLGDRLRVQSTGGALYLLASAPISPTRLQLQDADGGPLILIDVTARSPAGDEPPLQPIQIIDAVRPAIPRSGSPGSKEWTDRGSKPLSANGPTPVPVVLTRYAAQSLYAPLRTIEPLDGVTQVALPRDLSLDALLAALPVRARALAAWRLDDYWVTAVKVTNAARYRVTFDTRVLFGDFVAATFQHPDVGPSGHTSDTTVLYVVTRGRGLPEALPPAVSAIDAAKQLPTSGSRKGARNEE